MGKKGKRKEAGSREGKGKREAVEKWEGGEGNQLSGNFIYPCYLAKGWRLSEAGLALCSDGLENPQPKDIIRKVGEKNSIYHMSNIYLI